MSQYGHARTTMKRSALIVATVLVVSVGLWAAHHFMRPRFQGSVTHVDMSEPACIALMTAQPYELSESDAQATCFQATGAWFRASVKNVGLADGALTECAVEGLDSAGEVVFRGRLPVGPIMVPGSTTTDPVGKGQTVTWLWFIPHAQTDYPMSSISGLGLTYRATCLPFDFGGHIPT